MTHRVFVYGSLMQGFGNHRLLETSTFVSPATIEGHRLYSLGAFPAMLPCDRGDSVVCGEVYEVDSETLRRLDRLEGHPTFYERQVKPVYSVNHNGHFECAMYIFQHPVDPNSHVESGDWRSPHATKIQGAPLRG